MTQHRLTIDELEQVARDAHQAVRASGLLQGVENDPIFVITVATGSAEWSAGDFDQGDILTALSGAAGERIKCRYRFESSNDALSFTAHNLRWDRPEGDVKYADITARNKSNAVTDAVAAVTGAISSVLP